MHFAACFSDQYHFQLCCWTLGNAGHYNACDWVDALCCMHLLLQAAFQVGCELMVVYCWDDVYFVIVEFDCGLWAEVGSWGELCLLWVYSLQGVLPHDDAHCGVSCAWVPILACLCIMHILYDSINS